jgi:uncharacterized protein YegL
MPAGNPEFINNPESRCPVILLLDTSVSMSGQPIAELNAGLQTFKQSLDQDSLARVRVEVSIITFGPVEMKQDFITVDQFSPPHLSTTGVTPMGEAIEYGLTIIADRKQEYKDNGIPYYRPWIFLITDGGPTDEWKNAAQRVRDTETNKGAMFFAVGVQGADMNILSQIAPPNRPPVVLNGLDFKSMFQWLSASLGVVSRSSVGGEQVTLPQMGWGNIYT